MGRRDRRLRWLRARPRLGRKPEDHDIEPYPFRPARILRRNRRASRSALGGDGFPERVDGACCGFAQQRLELGDSKAAKPRSRWGEVGRAGRKNRSVAPAALTACRTGTPRRAGCRGSRRRRGAGSGPGPDRPRPKTKLGHGAMEHHGGARSCRRAAGRRPPSFSVAVGRGGAPSWGWRPSRR